MSDWKSLSQAEASALLNAPREPYKMSGHQFVTRKRMPWPVCKSCGLVALRNPRTAWCIKHGCNYDNHASFPVAMARFDQQAQQ